MVACLGAPMVAGAQDVVGMDAFDKVEAGSLAPTIYGWKLSNDAMSSSVMIDGVERALNLSDFFECGVALGKTAAEHGYRRGRCEVSNGAGPALNVYPTGALTLPRKNAEFDPANIGALLGTEVNALVGVPDAFMPMLGDAAPLAGAGACPDPHGTRGVYFYSSRIDEGVGGPDKMMITWNDILPADDCDAEPNSFQMIVTALPMPADAPDDVRPPARVEYRYGDCGWSVPDQDALPPFELGPDDDPLADLPDVHGARAGMLFNSAAQAGGEARRGIEVLGAREQTFTVSNPGTLDAGALAHGRKNGASGNPRRNGDFCVYSNVNAAPDARPKGHFVFDLTIDGIPLKDDDGDGVPDGVGGHDNCPGIANPYQGDADSLGGGDACDPDADEDNLLNVEEFCDLVPPYAWMPYPQNVDSDGDGLGDGCDNDLDNDGVSNYRDNCPEFSNPSQMNWDADDDGMRCDPDDEAVFARVAALIVSLAKAGWVPAGPMIEVVGFAHTQTMTYGTESPSFVERWANQSGKTHDEIWAIIDASLDWPLPASRAEDFRQAVEDAYGETADDNIWLLYSWSKTDLGLGEFVTKHGAWFIEGTD